MGLLSLLLAQELGIRAQEFDLPLEVEFAGLVPHAHLDLERTLVFEARHLQDERLDDLAQRGHDDDA